MKIEKLPSGSYRVRKTYKGKSYTIVFNHKPTQKEVTLALAEKMETNEVKGDSRSFENCALEYIDSKSNILSPSTIGGYHKILRQIDKSFKNKNIFDIDQLDINYEVNRYAKDRSPKTVANFHGFISAVFSLYRPKMKLTTTLPQRIKYEPYTPTNQDIKKILEASKDNVKYHICFQLGILSCRRSEVCALTMDDVNFEKGYISINKAFVYDKDNKPVIKKINKSTEGKRNIPVPAALLSEIKSNGFIIDVLPHNLVYTLHQYQHQLGIPEFRFHDLRHYFASYAHDQGLSDANIMAMGGWQTDYTMKRVYRHAMESENQSKQMDLSVKILS